MRIVLDTNTLISGTYWKGDSAEIMRMIDEGKLIFITSKDIIEEYMRVMNYKDITSKVQNHEARSAATLKLIQIATIIDPKEKIQIVKDDPTDDKFFEAAIEGKAEFIISSDPHILDIPEFREVKTIKPNDFLVMINKV